MYSKEITSESQRTYSPHLTSAMSTSMPELDLSSFLLHQQKEVGTFRAQFICPGFFFTFVTIQWIVPMKCLLPSLGQTWALQMSLFWSECCPTNCGTTRRIPGSHVGVLVHILYTWAGSFKSSQQLLVDSDQGQTKFNCRSQWGCLAQTYWKVWFWHFSGNCYLEIAHWFLTTWFAGGWIGLS